MENENKYEENCEQKKKIFLMKISLKSKLLTFQLSARRVNIFWEWD